MPFSAAFEAIDLFNPSELGGAPFWRGHLPFAGFLIALMKPRTVVELGVQNGDSLFAFSRAMRKFGPHDGSVIGIDAWEGDIHVGAQGEWIYQRVSSIASIFDGLVKLRRAYFVDALDEFDDGSIDLLHLDGTHTYEAARTDFHQYERKLSPRGVVLMHDIAVFRQDFGVWRAFLELKAGRPNFPFAHSCGLGLIGVGEDLDKDVAEFLTLPDHERRAMRKIFSALGRRAFLEHTSVFDQSRVMPIATLPPPAEAAGDSDFSAALQTGRW